MPAFLLFYCVTQNHQTWNIKAKKFFYSFSSNKYIILAPARSQLPPFFILHSLENWNQHQILSNMVLYFYVSFITDEACKRKILVLKTHKFLDVAGNKDGTEMFFIHLFFFSFTNETFSFLFNENEWIFFCYQRKERWYSGSTTYQETVGTKNKSVLQVKRDKITRI